MIEQILNQNTSKTNKMKQLFELGLTRKQVAKLLNVNYGFAHNVYVSIYGTRRNPRNLNQNSNDQLGAWKRTFGVEIEAYGVPVDIVLAKLREAGINVNAESYNHIDRDYWKIVSDSSIQGTNSFELVSPPLRGEQGLEELRKVCEVLVRVKAKVNKSCGLHVHFDARGYSLDSWKRLVYNYILMESEIDKMMPESRRGNNNRYCRSLSAQYIMGLVLNKGLARRKIFECDSLESLSGELTYRSRYFKVNIESYWRHKTVEFRQHSGTVEFEKISNWIRILNRLMNFSEQNEFQNQDFNLLTGILSLNLINYIKQRRAKFGF
ncbi:MAG: hypothetical protein CH6_0057 [Candidatus Kapaibacterium sp.]|nr:MAG: hypothetical protein CH6_0057 [Candidatus Kapabacteria bacterium]